MIDNLWGEPWPRDLEKGRGAIPKADRSWAIRDLGNIWHPVAPYTGGEVALWVLR